MANNQRFSITFDASLNVSQMKGALNDIQKGLNNLHLPQNATKGLQGTFSKLSEEIQKFEVAAGKEIGSKADFSKIEKSAAKIGELFGKLKLQVSELTGKSGKELEKLFPENISRNLSNASKALSDYNSKVSKVTSDISKTKQEIEDYSKTLDKVSKKPIWTDDQKNELAATKNEIKATKEQIEALYKEIDAYNSNRKQGPIQPENYKKSPVLREYVKQIENAQKELETLQQKQRSLEQTKGISITTETQAKRIQEFKEKIEEASEALKKLEEEEKRLSSSSNNGDLTKLIEQVGKLTGLDMSKFEASAEGVGQAIDTYLVQEGEKLRQGLGQLTPELTKMGSNVEQLGDKMVDLGQEVTNTDQRFREVDALKSRIQYFFGLNNTIELVKRTIRSAFETVKELDKAMTETAVVTDFSVADMWSQLPDYTKRANDLGVTTKAAYEAATLYYQQGLKTNEVTAMSNETLKMARIAGLDAAVATDRMTNAIRGFNMEINEMNAQRIDDVYSKLAAISASNVDEISTAMTKVASLANNANMEFETTSAFLAQIIETTRESAETAGTALKTVVARFSEVKKLVSEDQLKGQDEEGQLIDVNKVSQALRTAGVDLNKYFLGEVGLDDIFMELASKWDSLTTLQQRYIATQAAGSRQQSRFIALMSDYGRMQELVGEAYNANGAAAEQFAKTQESLESKLARLKNAWNEFAMGIANSDLVKAGVDFLTLLLNSVNKLTDGFGLLTGSVGGFISSILKLSLLIGGLGVGKNLIAGLGGGIGSLLAGKGVGTGFLGALSATNSKEALGKIFSGFGSGFSGIGNIGKGFIGGLQTLGTKWGAAGLEGSLFGKLSLGADKAVMGLTGSTGLASAAGGLAGIAGIAAAAGAAYIAVKKLYDLSPAGQVKIAEKYAENIGKIADEAKKTETSLKEAREKYLEYSKSISDTTDVQNYSKAIQDRNEYLTSLIEQDGSFAKYISSTRTAEGKIMLTLDEEAFSQAIKNAEEATQESQIEELLANAKVASAEANKYDSKASGAGPLTELALKYETLAQGKATESQGLVEQAVTLSLKDLDISSELSNAIANYYSNVADINTLTSTTLKATTEDLAALFTNANSNIYTQLFKAMSGGIDLSDEELESPKLEAALEKLTIALGKDLGQTKTQIKQAQEQRRELKQAKATNIYSQALQSGKAITPDYRNLIDTLDFDQITGISNILDSVKGKIDEDLFSSLFDSLPEMGESTFAEFSDFFKSFNLDAPIQAFKQLQDAKEKALEGSEFSKVLNSLEEVNAATFETSNLFKSFYQSDAYDSISDSLADFIEENGKISGENIEELAASCSDLDVLLNDTSLTAEGLARALNSLSDGTLSIDSLTNSVLAAISVGQDYESLLNEIHKTISDFDPGLDTGEGSDFIVEQAKNLNELIEGYEFGNEQTKNIYNKLFGEDAYQAFMSDWGEKGVDEFATEAQNRIQQLSDWAENNSYDFMKQFAGDQYGLGITQTGDYDFEWDISQFESTDAVLQKIMETANVSKDTAEMLFSGFAAQSYDLQEAWNQLDYKTKLDAFAEEIQTKTALTRSELEALGKALGKSGSEVLQDLQQLRGEDGKPINIPAIVTLKDSDGNDITGAGLERMFAKVNRTKNRAVFKDVAKDYAEQFSIELENGTKAIDVASIFSDLLSQGWSEGQAIELVDKFVTTLDNGLLAKTIKIPKIEMGENPGETIITSIDKVITADSMSSLTAAENAAMEAANYDLIAQNIAENDFSGITDSIESAVETAVAEAGGKLSTLANSFNGSTIQSRILSAVNSGISQAKTAFANAGFKANVALTFTGTASGGIVNKPNANNSGGRHTGKYQQRETTTASGGIVKSSASGNRLVAPGISLTGEEDPEIVWNKEQGYAYITGKNGPEFQNLQPGDRVFNADETKKILKRSKENKTFSSFASGGYNPKIVSGAGTGSSSKTSSKTSSNSEKTSDEWKNELDWLYNLMEDIAESERTQEKLATKHERYLKDATKTGKDLYNITKQQMQNLNQQYAYQKQALAGREREMQEQINQSGYTDYVWWNNNDRTIEINWDKIEGLQDKDTYDKVSELVSKAEDIQSKIDAAEDALLDIQGQMGELQERYIQEYIDFEQRTLEAVVAKYQEGIDELSSLDDTLNKANDDILNSIRREIDLQRQIRDNTDTENNINDMETRLAYLRRDTTGANQNEILQLEKQIREARQGYSDTLVDQSLDRLSEANEEASEQRQHQIELLTDQLEYWQKTGALWEEVDTLLKEAMGPSGRLDVESQLVKLIENAESFQGMSKTQQENFLKELEEAFKTIPAFQQMQEHPNYDNSKMYITDALSEIFEDGMIAWNSPQFQSYLKERNEKYVSEGWGTEEQAAIEMEALKTLAENYQGKTVSNSYQKSAYNSGADYKDLMNNLIKIYGSEATKRPEWAMASQARISKIVEEAVASGKGAAYVESEWQRALFEQEVLNQTATSKQPFNFGVDKKWIDDDPTNDGPDYRYEMLKIIANKGARALNDYDYLRYAGLREAKVVALGGSLDKARLAQAELNALATPEGQLLVKKALADGLTGTALSQRLNLRYKKGGLVTRTGPAWLDGTSREPEYVLNARQTDAFLRLAEVLPSALGRGSSLTNTIGGNVYLELTMNVGEIGSDYDVDRLVDRVKQDIYDAGAYRNINVISSIR